MKLLLQPLPVRIFHWTMFFAISTLVLTGLYLSNPAAEIHLRLGTVRLLHLTAAMVLITNTAGQLYYYIVSRKFTEILLLPRDLGNLRSFLRYYLFITDRTPNYGRYNPGQKALFTVWLLAVLLAIPTGMVLLFPDDTTRLQKLLHGLVMARILHYSVAMLFAGTIPFHLYLVFTEDPAKLQAMFTGYLKKEPKAVPAPKSESRPVQSEE